MVYLTGWILWGLNRKLFYISLISIFKHALSDSHFYSLSTIQEGSMGFLLLAVIVSDSFLGTKKAQFRLTQNCKLSSIQGFLLSPNQEGRWGHCRPCRGHCGLSLQHLKQERVPSTWQTSSRWWKPDLLHVPHTDGLCHQKEWPGKTAGHLPVRNYLLVVSTSSGWRQCSDNEWRWNCFPRETQYGESIVKMNIWKYFHCRIRLLLRIMEACHLNITLICILVTIFKNLPNERILWVMKPFIKINREDGNLQQNKHLCITRRWNWKWLRI